MNIIFAERLRNLRKEKGISQAELAKALDLTQRKISYLETGQFEPDLTILWKLSLPITQKKIRRTLSQKNAPKL